MIKLHLKKLLCEIIDKYNLCVVNVQRISERKQLYNNEIRSLISKIKKFERCDSSGKNYEKKLIKPDAKTDRKIARYNSDTVKKSIRKNGLIGKRDFWKLKKRLLPKSHNIPDAHALQDQSGCEITDPVYEFAKQSLFFKIRG